MEHHIYIAVLFCLVAICTVSGRPNAKAEDDKDNQKNEVCMDWDTACDRYLKKTYICGAIQLGSLRCRKTCGLCTPSPDDVLPEGNPKCTIEYSSGKVTYPTGMYFTKRCESLSCDEGGAGGTDIHCSWFDLPDPKCEWTPPENPDHCCPVPSCPDGIQIKYPEWWNVR